MKDGRRGKSGAAVAVVLIFVLLFPMLYVLSVGPMLRLNRSGVVRDSAMETLYFPLAWLHDHALLEGPLDWYIELWEPD